MIHRRKSFQQVERNMKGREWCKAVWIVVAPAGEGFVHRARRGGRRRAFTDSASRVAMFANSRVLHLVVIAFALVAGVAGVLSAQQKRPFMPGKPAPVGPISRPPPPNSI